MGELIFFIIIPILAFIFTTMSYFLLKKYNINSYYMYIIPFILLPFSIFVNVGFYLFIFFYISCSYVAYSYYHNT